MSKTFVGGSVGREFESEAPMEEEVLDGVICSGEQLSFQMCLKSGNRARTIGNWRQEFLTAVAMVLNALDWKLNLVAG